MSSPKKLVGLEDKYEQLNAEEIESFKIKDGGASKGRILAVCLQVEGKTSLIDHLLVYREKQSTEGKPANRHLLQQLMVDVLGVLKREKKPVQLVELHCYCNFYPCARCILAEIDFFNAIHITSLLCPNILRKHSSTLDCNSQERLSALEIAKLEFPPGRPHDLPILEETPSKWDELLKHFTAPPATTTSDKKDEAAEMGASGGLSHAETESKVKDDKGAEVTALEGPSEAEAEPQVWEFSDDKHLTSAYAIKEDRYVELQRRLKEIKHLTRYYIDLDGVVKATCLPTDVNEVKAKFLKIHEDFGVKLHLREKVGKVILASDPVWTLGAVQTTQKNDQQTEIVIGSHFGSPGLPVTVTGGQGADGGERKALMVCCHVVSQILKDVKNEVVEDQVTTGWFGDELPRTVMLQNLHFGVYSSWPELGFANSRPSKLGNTATGTFYDKADVALVYLDDEVSDDDIPTVEEQPQSPYVAISDWYNTLLEGLEGTRQDYKVRMRGAKSGFTKGKIYGVDGLIRVAEVTPGPNENPIRELYELIVVIGEGENNSGFGIAGDSGSPVFIKHGDTWKLLGVFAAFESEVHEYPISYVIPIKHQVDGLKDHCDVVVKVADVHACFPSRFRY